LKNVQDLMFLKILVGKSVRPVKVPIWGQEFFVSNPHLGYLQVECKENIEVKAVSDKTQLVNFFVNNTINQLGPTNDQIFDQFALETMKAMMGPDVGATYEDLEMLIGSLASTRPDETECYLGLLRQARHEMKTEVK
jgi:hypothetical protein